jgi:predicted GIY-YIG superfamily endonuclease
VKTHTLYRFFNAAGDLLYVGITNSPPRRFQQHKADKEWWSEVASITLAEYQSRAALMAAEREAVRNECPRYNKMLQSPATTNSDSRPEIDSVLPLGAFVALGLIDGRCPIGKVVYFDDVWVTVGHKDFMGYYDSQRRSYRVESIVEIAYAYRDAEDDRIDDEHLDRFASRWTEEHKEIR